MSQQDQRQSQQEANKTEIHVYAEALYDVASELNTVAQIEEELLAVQQVLNKDEKLQRFMESPTVSFDIKRKVISEGLKGLSKPLLNFLLLAIEHERISMFNGMVYAFHQHANAKAGIAEISVRSAEPLPQAQIDRLNVVLGNRLKRKIQIHQTVDPKLLGGIVLKHGDKSWDGSLSHKLKVLVRRMEEAESAKGLARMWTE